MTINEFIDKVIVKELREIVCKKGYHYHGFILIACATEFAGALLDDEAFNTKKKGCLVKGSGRPCSIFHLTIKAKT